jgi:hypothetical protein
MKQKKGDAPMQVRVVLAGDQRLAENVILEVRAIAQRHGLEIPDVSVIRQLSVGSKSKKSTSRRKSKSRAARSSSI